MSCRDEDKSFLIKTVGCKDVNAVNYNPEAKKDDGLCKYRYLYTITVKYIPFFTDNKYKDSWDDINNADLPDLKFYLKNVNNYYWTTETPIAFENGLFPYTWRPEISADNYLYWNEEYVFLLSDEDNKDRDIIFTGTFYPEELYNDDKIILRNTEETVEIELSFIVF